MSALIPPPLHHGDTIAAIVAHAKANGLTRVEADPAAQAEWVEFLLTGPGSMAGAAPDCTPGYYNNEGAGYGDNALFGAGYPPGAVAWFRYIDDWRKSGAFKGLAFS